MLTFKIVVTLYRGCSLLIVIVFHCFADYHLIFVAVQLNNNNDNDFFFN